jgi:hypothetical protein
MKKKVNKAVFYLYKIHFWAVKKNVFQLFFMTMDLTKYNAKWKQQVAENYVQYNIIYIDFINI